MKSISDLRDRIDSKTWILVLLTILTTSFYPFAWMYKHNQEIFKITRGEKVNNNLVIAIIFLFAINFFIPFYLILLISPPIVLNLFITSKVVLAILVYIWVFKVRDAIQEYALKEYKLDYRMNIYYTFLFSIFYINYCINDLPIEFERKNILLSVKEDDQQEKTTPKTDN
ncbi:MAG: hypothetical protein CR982_02525 [Candidatus Cloacimonadota bacterium]|nr:MAG: hypothetical protein CR982_02525 [Candidatus Cloacimonadota bacterium]PIE78522.1 MAG: hypothetical protein CSA15_07455 [Candidatus Delongbacteria bacterium]